jgi:hypothetical protein
VVVVVVVGIVVAAGRDGIVVVGAEVGATEAGPADVGAPEIGGAEVGLLRGGGGGEVAAGRDELHPERSPVTRHAAINAPAGHPVLISPNPTRDRVIP